MGGERKKKGKSNHMKEQQPTSKQVNIVLPSDMNAEQMKEVIADAILLAENKRKIMAEEQSDKYAQQQKADVLNHIRYREISGKGVTGKVRGLGYSIKLLFTIITYPREKIRGDTMLMETIRVVIGVLFSLVCYGTILTWFIAWVFEIYYLHYSLEYLNFLWYLVPATFLIFPISGLFRIMSIEIEKMQDKNTLLNIASIVLVIITLIVTVVTTK